MQFRRSFKFEKIERSRINGDKRRERERESAVTKPRRVECANGARGLDGVCADPYIGSSSQRVEKGWSEQE